MISIYFNLPNKRITIHRPDCKNIGKNGFKHESGEGGWVFFNSKNKAFKYVDMIRLLFNLPELNICKDCKFDMK